MPVTKEMSLRTEALEALHYRLVLYRHCLLRRSFILEEKKLKEQAEGESKLQVSGWESLSNGTQWRTLWNFQISYHIKK